jgi:hypothetical protein
MQNEPPNPDDQASPPPVIVPPAAAAEAPASLASGLAVLLSLFVGAFLADGVISLLDDTLILFGNMHVLAAVRAVTSAIVLLLAAAVYVLMGVVPMIPKRLFLPLVLFAPVVMLACVPLLIYRHAWMHLVGWGTSLAQVGFGMAMLFWIRGGVGWSWPLVPRRRMLSRPFRWRHLLGFVGLNLFVALPGVVVYLACCTFWAVDYHSAGFVAVRPGGITVEARKYVRDDGKVIRLYPMAHVADAGFYRRLSQACPTNAVILMEGVTDEHGLLTNHISYQRMAESLGVAEQEAEFVPPGEWVAADVDVSEFTPDTIAFLNIVMRFHARGPDLESLRLVFQYKPPPGFERQLLEDLLRKRNRHLMTTARSRLADAELLVIPWGAAHMPELASEIEKLGFRVAEKQRMTVLAFGRKRN